MKSISLYARVPSLHACLFCGDFVLTVRDYNYVNSVLV